MLSNAKARDLFPISDSSSLNEKEQLLEKFDKLTGYLVITISVQFQETSFSGEQANLKRFMDWIHCGHMKATNEEMRFRIEAVTATP